MKIGFIGNINNYPFMLAQAIRRRGEEVRFIVTSTQKLHRPEHRFGDVSVFDDWVFDLAPLRTFDCIFPTPKRAKAKKVLGECDAIVANDYGIALAAQIQKPLFIVSTGSDLDILANWEYYRQIVNEGSPDIRSRVRTLVKKWAYRRLIRYQREGFRQAIGLEYAPPGILEHGDALLDEIGFPSDRRRSFMLTDLERISMVPFQDNSKLRILCIARLNWVEPFPPGYSVLDNKRVDILFRGVEQFRNTFSGPFELRIVMKGLHVQETKELVNNLGLWENVVWLPEMTQAEFMQEMMAADIIADHFGPGAIGMGARDAIAMGRPVIANGKPDIFNNYIGEPLPLANAETPQEVAAALSSLVDADKRQELAARARVFAERHFSADLAAANVVALIEDSLGCP